MKSFNQTVSDFKILSNDSSVANDTLGKSLINIALHKVLAMSNWTFNKDSKTFSSVASQQSYDPPYNAARIEYVSVTFGSVVYVPKEVRDGKDWAILNSVVVTSDVPQYWYVSNRTKKISVFPVPASVNQTWKIGFLKKNRDYSASDYTTGTVTTTANSTAIVGAGTSWNKAMIGRYIQISGTNTILDGFWFEITAVTDTTHLTVREFAPVAVATASYTLTEMMPFPDGFEEIPLWFALDKYYQMKEKPVLAREYEKMWTESVAEMERKDSRSATGLLEKQGDLNPIDPNINPWGITILNL